MNWLALLLVLHLAGMALWLGGMAFALVMRSDEQVALAVLPRLLGVIDLAMPLTLATGWALAALAYGRPALWPWALNAMQTAGIAMGAIFLLIRFGPGALLSEALASGDREESAAQQARIGRLLAASCGLGTASLVFAALLQS